MHRLLAALLAATACASIAQAQTASPVDTGAAQPQSTSPALIGPSFTVDRALELAGVVSPSLEARSEEHTSELQSLMRISYAVFCLKKNNNINNHPNNHIQHNKE